MLLLTQNFKVALGVTISLVLATGCAQHDLADVSLSDQLPADQMAADLVDQSSANAEQEEDADVVNLVDHMSESSSMMDQTYFDPFTTSPWKDFLEDHEIQVDPDGGGAHNFDEWVDREGVDISWSAFVKWDELYLRCPTGNNDRRRTEFRDNSNRSLNDKLVFNLKCKIWNAPSNKKTIIAQLHNDASGVQRPYITVFIEGGTIYAEQSKDYNGSNPGYNKPEAAQQAYSKNAYYEIRFYSPNNQDKVKVSIKNMSTNEFTYTWFYNDDDWDNSNVEDDFYVKFGTYMPNGGANNTYSRVEWVYME